MNSIHLKVQGENIQNKINMSGKSQWVITVFNGETAVIKTRNKTAAILFQKL
jgi:hypothetical protein